jgi:hypothetical protein
VERAGEGGWPAIFAKAAANSSLLRSFGSLMAPRQNRPRFPDLSPLGSIPCRRGTFTMHRALSQDYSGPYGRAKREAGP